MTSGQTALIADLEICVARQTIRHREREVRLPDLSFRLLRLLSERAPEPVSFDEIERVVWGAHVSRETIKQRAKMLRDCLAALGVEDGGVQSARNVGYRLTQTLGVYQPPAGGRPASNRRRIAVIAGALATCLCALVIYLSQADARDVAPLSLSVRSDGVGTPSSPAWTAAQQRLVTDLSKMSNLRVVPADARRAPDLVVEMERFPTGASEALMLELVETATGTALWSETYGLDEEGYEKPISDFVAHVHEQVDALGLRPRGRDLVSDRSNRPRQLYLSASSLAKSDREGDLAAARTRLDTALQLRPDFAIARSLRARIDAELVMAHGRDPDVARRALGEAQALVDANPEAPEFRRTLAAVQIATGELPAALQNLETAERNMPFLRQEVVALRRRIEDEGS